MSDLIQFLYTDYFKVVKIIVDVTCVAFGFIFLNRMNRILTALTAICITTAFIEKLLSGKVVSLK